ncbi:MAG: hypothetical protein LUD78_08350, partial [Clostridiales bacterium]|nr:hypothetical protein [Clostridiales bacterium]
MRESICFPMSLPQDKHGCKPAIANCTLHIHSKGAGVSNKRYLKGIAALQNVDILPCQRLVHAAHRAELAA